MQRKKNDKVASRKKVSLSRSRVYQIQQHQKDFSICNIKMLALKIVIIASVANLTKLKSDKA